MSRKRIIAGRARHLYGWVKDRPDHRDAQLSVPRLKALMLPSKGDVRPFCSRIENQGDIGSCTANSTTTAMEYLYNKLGKPQPELSRLFLYYATRVWVAKENPEADNGAMIRDVMKALVTYGVCFEKTWGYNERKFAEEPSGLAKAEALQHQILHYFRCPSLRYIRASIHEGYPCVGGFAVPESMDMPKAQRTGVVDYPKPTENFMGGHAVLFVGYDDKKKLLTFQNSWGVGWGDHGFGYLPYAYVEEGLANDFWTIRRSEL